MKKMLLVLMMAMLAVPVFAQSDGNSETVVQQQNIAFTRGKGFFARPEFYGGVVLNGGYQFNPYFQASLGAGVALTGLGNHSGSVILTHAGIRFYTGEKKWAGMFDFHTGLFKYARNMYFRHSLVAGASYKDLDFGPGIAYISMPSYGRGAFGLLITVGWNVRFYPHR